MKYYVVRNYIFKIYISLQARVSKEIKELSKTRKNEIQKELKKRLNIKVDYPRQGLGNSNTGNTARKFFDGVDIVAEVTRKTQE